MSDKFKKQVRFSISIAVITFVLAAIFTVISSSIMSDVIWVIGICIVLVIVLIGVLFDMLGIAAAAAEETPFHSMAAEKVPGSKEALVIIKNADRFASFCNDVIGDISGIVSGTATAIVVLQLTNIFGYNEGSSVQIVTSVVLTSIVAALTVGGKALGKSFAIHSSTSIIFFAARVIHFIQSKTKLNLLGKAHTSRKKSS
jgi:CBS domain containing-hemolysin-like protein